VRLAAVLAVLAAAVHADAAVAAADLLTGPSERRPAAVAVDYVRSHERAFGLDADDLDGLRLARAYRSGSGAVHLWWEQVHAGIPAFGAGLRANVDPQGRLISIGGNPRADLTAGSLEPRLTALDALLAAGRDAGVTVVPGVAGTPSGPERTTDFTQGHRAGLVLFGSGPDVSLAWRVVLRGGDEVYDAVVDARSGATLYRASMVRHASGLAFEHYPGASAGGTQVLRTFPETGADPWITEPARLFGDNVHVYSDPADSYGLSGPAPADEVPPSSPGTWSYLHDARPASSVNQDCPPVPGCSWDGFDTVAPNFSWRVNRAQAGTQLFYYLNRFHDHLRDAAGIGFDDSSGNFEGTDRVIAQFDDGATTDTGPFDDFPDCAHLNNAGVVPVPDGMPLLMRVFLWSSACQTGGTVYDVNGADDALLVYHEYAHGLTGRLVTDASGFPALGRPPANDQPGALDEGFADWYAFDFLTAQGLTPDSSNPGELRAGRYQNVALRTEPIDCPVGAGAPACPGTAGTGPGGYTYGDFGKVLGLPDVHADGEIWGQTMWDLRRSLIAAHGPADGVVRTRALVTDGLRLSMPSPTFLAMRDAILQANVNRRFGDRDRIWAVFAARGMGVGARTTGPLDATPVEDFTAPPPEPGPAGRDTTRPSISRFSMTRRRFRVGYRRTARVARATPRGTEFRFRLSERATVRISISAARPGRRVRGRCRPATRRTRGRPHCTRYLVVATLTRRNRRPGGQAVPFSGRVGRKALRRGGYRASISAADAAGNRSRARRLSFTVVRR
jgi:hypothetical protein